MEFEHIPVLYNETINALNVKPEGIYADGTLGGAGHASGVCKLLNKEGRFIGFDQDAEAIKTATQRLSEYKENTNIDIVKSNYVNMPSVLKEMGVDKVDGILLDIGVSSYQLDNGERGFSYMEDAKLDMRMDKDNPLSAYEVVNTYTKEDLARIIRNYGEDNFANNIAKHIVQRRNEKPIETTFELAGIIKESIPAKIRATGGNPAKRTFQAIRIEVNKELEVLEKSIDAMIDMLNPGGRLAIITFHSLEDRIVKNKFKEAEDPCICPKTFPVCVCGRVPLGKQITRKPIIPSEEEISNNKRSKSSKLRVFEKA
ncbi:16S rRNA (cytosine(1402)-N(4))-methyltransferase RsmH [uncultured Methanobrevibacter sp.]|uniref:16S rRNA (cytosine(1402)-N(4))-methyltransferase RsmH n=1 Tax=uncultured Methanobrevibacter sp. TaxID=253161 RepID=UPI00262F0946